uniref:Uncharacterized protein n=1 Tax=Meloidogyne enterolobii TaxID=390850 RepID=A0A6V7VJ22_MELEN|nr:unnamed protein product [Meloidogyne enterolobii]
MTTPQPTKNFHAPLRRVLPEKQSSGVQNVVIQQQQQHISSHPLLFNLKSNDTTTSIDSSYSSDHSTLSRETSDSSNTSSSSKEFFEKNFLEEFSVPPLQSLSNNEEKEINNSLLEFAIRLGFDKQQLKIVLNKLNKNGQKEEDDKVLLELIKLGGRRKEEELNNNNYCNNNYLKLLRPIVIDGSNIAITHGNKAFFSCRGIRECVNYFTERGHTDILVFVPQFRREQSRSDSPIIDQHILNELEKKEN